MCMPAATFIASQPRPTFISSRNTLLGVDDPTDAQQFEYRTWQSLWVAQEPQVFVQPVFGDRDFREVVSAKYTYVNGRSRSFTSCHRDRTGMIGIWVRRRCLRPMRCRRTFRPQPVGMAQGRCGSVGSRNSDDAAVSVQVRNPASARACGLQHVLCRDFVAPAGLQLPPSKNRT